MPQKTVQHLDAYIKATAVVYNHSNTKLISRKTKVKPRRKQAFLSGLHFRKTSSDDYYAKRRPLKRWIRRESRGTHQSQSNTEDVKQKLHLFVRTSLSKKPKTLYFELHPETLASSLKETIQKRIGVEARYQRLYIRRNFQLCDLLTLEENGVGKDEIISLHLSVDGPNDDSVAKDKANIEDEYLKDLSSKSELSWKELAEHLGYAEAEIADIQSSNEGSNEAGRHMLLTWWEKTADRDEAAQKLRRALEAIGLTDLAQNVPVTNESRDEAARPVPDRRHDSGVDEENKESKVTSTKEKTQKSFSYVQVFIRCNLTQKPRTLCFQLDPETSVWCLKQILNEIISVHPQQQRLFIRRNSRNFELCNLLTLYDYGIQHDENISLRLCTDGLLGGGPKAEISELTLSDVVRRLGHDWKELATHLGFTSADISTFEADNPGKVYYQKFQMLVAWRQRQPTIGGQMDVLCAALTRIDRTDIVTFLQGRHKKSRQPVGTQPADDAGTSTRPSTSHGVGVSDDTSSSEISEPTLSDVARRLGHDWKRLATHLGLTYTDILTFVADNPGNVYDQKFQMLVAWRRRQPTIGGQMDMLCAALTKIDRNDIVMSLQGPTGGFAPRTDQTNIQQLVMEYNKDTTSTIPAHPLDPSRTLDIDQFSELELTQKVEVWDNLSKLPDQLTALYTQFADVLVSRRCNEGEDQVALMKSIVRGLGPVALTGLLDPKGERLVFSSEEFEEKALEDGCRFGFLQQESFTSGLKKMKVVSFVHKSMQEYFAAYYFANLHHANEDEFHEKLQQINPGNVHAMEYLLRFACGISSGSLATALILEHVQKQRSKAEFFPEIKLQQLTHLCLLESGCGKLADKLDRPTKAKCDSQEDLLAMRYYLQCLRQPLVELKDLTVRCISHEELAPLRGIDSLLHDDTKVRIDLWIIGRLYECLKLLGEILPIDNIRSIRRFRVYVEYTVGDKPDEEMQTAVVVDERLRDQIELTLDIGEKFHVDERVLGSLSRVCKQIIKEVRLRRRTYDDVIRLANALAGCDRLNRVDVSHTNLHGHLAGLAPLVPPSLVSLTLRSCGLNDDDVPDLISILPAGHGLRWLDVGDNAFSVVGVQTLTAHLRNMPKLGLREFTPLAFHLSMSTNVAWHYSACLPLHNRYPVHIFANVE
ncbi:uncharacterized protein LOC119725418 [Patiria miniata]|uniref:Uncharacterized protein n=1 Tax=Patiria miniata TaxID=46514 RepID=A0A913ZNY2_PATMI|nr:uncharacterized protein LOC119725418 [Patiria miniata]